MRKNPICFMAGAFAATSMVASVNATILTFDPSGSIPSSADMFDTFGDYGQNVTSASEAAGTYGNGGEGFTPDVVVDYEGNVFGGGTRPWQAEAWVGSRSFNGQFYSAGGYGGLDGNVLYLIESGGNQQGIVPILGLRSVDPSIDVQFYGLEVDGFGANESDVILRVYEGSLANLVYTSPTVSTTDNPASFGTQSGGSPLVVGQELIIEIEVVNQGANTNLWAIDNVRFGQIPEPGTLMLGAAGCLAMLMRRRRS